MKRKETEYKIRQAYRDIIEDLAGQGRSERLAGYERAVRHGTKFDSCGRLLTTSYGREVAHWCRRPVCPTCATFWGRKLAQKLVAACPEAVIGDYRMLTLVAAVVPTPDDAFDQFRVLRRALGNALDYRRRVPSIDRAGWRAFAVAGALELDHFMAEDFGRLGDRKQTQYRALGFDGTRAHGPQWVVTVHALVHVGALGNAAVTALFQGLVPVVHLQPLDTHKGLVENTENILGYAAKVGLTTALASGEVQPWSPEVIAKYVAATMRCSHGRQGFKLSVYPKRKKREQIKKYRMNYLEPLPVLF